MLSESDDEKLMAQIFHGDVAAFERLYDCYAPAVLEFGLKLNLETAVAEQIVLETFWAVWQQAEVFGAQSISFPLWLRQLARQVSLNKFRFKIMASGQPFMEVHNDCFR